MIAIKNMEMPKSCEVCDFRKSDPYSGEVYCSKAIGSNTIIYEKERLENCPLVEIVTCEDCKDCTKSMVKGKKFLWCEREDFCTSEDCYCGDGERRE